MQTFLPAQAVPPQTAEVNHSFADPADTGQAGEEAARAVARMRHRAIDNWGQIAHFTQAALAENCLSYRDQEIHTGVGASTVYRMALGNPVGVRAVQQFAAFATYSACHEETKAFWAAALSRLNPAAEGRMNEPLTANGKNNSASAGPEEIAALYSQLLDPASRKAVTQLLRTLHASEAER